MSCITRHHIMTTLKILLIAALIVVNMAIFNGNLKLNSNSMVANREASATEEPTATVIPTATAANHVEHVIQQRFEKRSDNVRKICDARGSKAASVTKPQELFDVPSIGLLWCPTFKAGSSNWLDLFCKANFNHQIYENCDISTMRANNPTTRYLSVSAEEFHYNKVMKQELGLPFMTVRNPVTRFLSAYRDKWEMGRSPSFYKKRYGEEIVRRYRSVDPILSEEEKEALLVEAGNVIMNKQLGSLSHEELVKNPYLNPPGPTFKEFVKWAINGGMDPHIMPYYQSCAPCSIDYNILRLEKLNEESGYLFSVIERSYLNLDFRMSLNVHGKTDECLLKYFRTISKHDLQLLYSMFFKVDCDLYSYPCKDTMNEVLALGRISKEVVRC